MAKMNDNTPMPFGKHKGKAMVEVPASYLLWYWNEHEGQSTVGMYPDKRNVLKYIEENLDVLKKEVRESK